MMIQINNIEDYFEIPLPKFSISIKDIEAYAKKRGAKAVLGKDGKIYFV